MRRYSILWWWLVLPTSVVVGLPVFFLAGQVTGLGLPERLALAIGATFAVDFAVAAWMESFAPTKLNIGPGEKARKYDSPAEQATVVSGFDASPRGKVSVRGETWVAVRLAGDSGVLSKGMPVRVVDRNGLELVVASNGCQPAGGQPRSDPDRAGA